MVGDLARSTRFRWFDQPLVDAERSSVLAGVRDEVAALAADPDAPDRAERIEALAAIPEQIVRFLAERLEDGVPEQEPMLEVLVAAPLPRARPARPRARCRGPAARSRWPTTRSTTGRPGWSPRVGTMAELTDPDSALTAALGAEVAARNAR